MMEMFNILIVTVLTPVYAFVRIHRTVHQKMVKSYLNKSNKSDSKPNKDLMRLFSVGN